MKGFLENPLWLGFDAVQLLTTPPVPAEKDKYIKTSDEYDGSDEQKENGSNAIVMIIMMVKYKCNNEKITVHSSGEIETPALNRKD